MIKYADYSNSSLNAINSVLHYYGVNTSIPGLQELDDILNSKKYRKIIFCVLDGFGSNLIDLYLKDSFLAKHKIKDITSVFPSTTTAAMNSYYSGKPPISHGWLGWSCFFKECMRTINLFPGTDKYDRSPIEYDYREIISYKDIFTQIKEVKNIPTKLIQPKHLKSTFNGQYLKFKSLKRFVKLMKKEALKDNEEFVFAYLTEPDHSEHHLGLKNDKIKNIVTSFNDLMAKHFSDIPEDTLVIISADHGLIDIEKTIYLEDYPLFLDTLVTMPFVEPRASSFIVKKDKEETFVKLFKEIFKDDYLLLTKDEALKMGLFGNGEMHRKIGDYLVDYFAIATSSTIYDINRKKDGFTFKAHHAGINSNETTIPLIIIKSE